MFFLVGGCVYRDVHFNCIIYCKVLLIIIHIILMCVLRQLMHIDAVLAGFEL